MVSSCRKQDTPEVKVTDDDLLVYFRLCKAGYASSVTEAAGLSARVVLQALHYEKFCNDYENAYLELNRGA